MNVAMIKRGLMELGKSFKPILDEGTSWTIDEAISQLDRTRSRYVEGQRQSHHPNSTPTRWGYWITSEFPLRFRATLCKDVNFWVDLYCTVLWEDEGELPVEQDIHLRVWSDDPNYTFRDAWDSDALRDKLSSGRVLLRCHFDLANPDQQGPKYHLQYGGNPRDEEFCWFPKQVRLPRIPYPPMDLILVCQLVATNFFWDEYGEFHDTPEWKGALTRSQEHLLRTYYTECLDALSDDLLAKHLWNGSHPDDAD